MDDSTDTSSERAISQDTFYSLWSDPLRRAALGTLENEGTPVTVTELASAVADQQGTVDTVDDIETQLHHTHLPKLDDAGILHYNTKTNTVELCFFERLPRDGLKK